MFDADAIAAIRRTAHFYNVGRGATVDEDALIEALERGAIAGAALDVFVEEPLAPASPLWSMPNVIVSPHICGDLEGWEETVVALFVDNLRRFVAGEPLRNPVDVRAGFGVG
jgi:phosphoglycerate dehydrogenase-like enzyme